MSIQKINFNTSQFFRFLTKINFPDNNLDTKQKQKFFFNIKNDTCWEWNAYRDIDGYGRFHALQAHRCSYYFYHYIDPLELFVCHSCDNPSCVNPNHLWLGTLRDNEDDKTSKGRRVKMTSTLSNSNILTEKEIITIFNNIENGFFISISQISDHLEINIETIRNIINGKSWKETTKKLPHDLRFYKKLVHGRLSEDTVIEIYKKNKIENINPYNLASIYNISVQTAYNICNKKCWVDILNKIDINGDIV